MSIASEVNDGQGLRFPDGADDAPDKSKGLWSWGPASEALPSRLVCHVCRRVVHVRLDGLLRVHLDGLGLTCSGSHQGGRMPHEDEELVP